MRPNRPSDRDVQSWLLPRCWRLRARTLRLKCLMNSLIAQSRGEVLMRHGAQASAEPKAHPLRPRLCSGVTDLRYLRWKPRTFYQPLFDCSRRKTSALVPQTRWPMAAVTPDLWIDGRASRPMLSACTLARAAVFFLVSVTGELCHTAR